nr:MAG TPA: hypothetical protein [Caudoviricetes sp.]
MVIHNLFINSLLRFRGISASVIARAMFIKATCPAGPTLVREALKLDKVVLLECNDLANLEISSLPVSTLIAAFRCAPSCVAALLASRIYSIPKLPLILPVAILFNWTSNCFNALLNLLVSALNPIT